MRIAFYAPMKPPTHGTPSGDRRVAGLYMDALANAGHRVELASTFRSYDPTGDAQRVAALAGQGRAHAAALAAKWLAASPGERPSAWFTYHLYYKAPDWLGAEVSAALGIPYLVAEASHAPKRAAGRWAAGHAAAEAQMRRASLLIAPTRDDAAGLERVAGSPDRVLWLPPFLDTRPYDRARESREATRARIAGSIGADAAVPWIAIAAMMRHGDKLESYRALARTLRRLADSPWQLLVAGDGPAREDVREAFGPALAARIHYLGEQREAGVAGLYAASDLCVWPAVNEAYGMALLEAMASGLPVVAGAVRGVPDVVQDGLTGELVPAGDEEALAAATARLLADGPARARLGAAAARFVRRERSLERASRLLGERLEALA